MTDLTGRDDDMAAKCMLAASIWKTIRQDGSKPKPELIDTTIDLLVMTANQLERQKGK